ncbi:MAG: Serine/threonine-protein kinase PknD [Verrucomicrobiae bacterium]|nr:Serine/threonine-protein kinase PknD [Verrucomicrobiae bacterium]
MPDQNLPITPPSGDSTWLEQYYTASKTHERADGVDDAGYSVTAHIAAADKYAVGEEVGSGGMKSVRRARDQNANRDVAMAVLLDEKHKPRFLRRFVREARLTAALEHPNIVPVHEVGMGDDGRPYFTMKLLGGESLHSILQKLDSGEPDYRQRYSLARLLQIFLGAGNAVAFAHSRGVIHLDLKPANIQVGGFGEVLVLDWGLAKIMERPGALELPAELRVVHTEGVVRGTPGFMAPEQIRGEYSKFDERTDVYALGVVLSTVLTGKLPAPNERPVFDRRVPVALQAVALKAQAAAPADRYQSVRDLLRDVQAFLGGYATSAQQASALTVLWLLIKRQKRAATLVAVSAVVILTIGVVAFVRIARSERVALDALEQIRQEQAANRKLGLLAAPRVYQRAGELFRAYDYDGGMEQLNFAVALDKTLAPAWTVKAWLHLGRTEFDEALTAFGRASGKPLDRSLPPPEKPKTLEELALKYLNVPPLLTKEQRLALAGELYRLGRAQGEWMQWMLGQFFTLQNRRTVDFEIVNAEFKILNPDAKNLEVVPLMTADGLTVAVRGDKVVTLLPLLGLSLTAVDVSGAIGADLNPLRAMSQLRELRLVRWPRNLFSRLWPLTQLTRVVVAAPDVVPLQNDLKVRMPKPPEVVGE